MNFFIALSFERKDELKPVISTLEKVLERYNHTYNTMVYMDLEDLSNKEMMEMAHELITKSDVLIVEGSTKEVGVGIEMGIAYAKGKKVILLKKSGSEQSTTMSGIATFSPIEYEDEEDLEKKFDTLVKNMSSKSNTG